MTLALLIQAVATGLTNGIVYALIGLGIAVIFRGSRTINVVQGDIVVVSALVAVAGLLWLSVPIWLACIGGVVAGILFGLAIEAVCIGPLIRRGAEEDGLLLVSIGLAVTSSAAVLLVAGRGSYLLPAVGGNAVIELGGATIRVHALFIIVAGAVIACALALFFRKTMFGLSMLAAAMNADGATVVGIDVGIMRRATFALGGALGALAGLLVAPMTEVGFQMGLSLTLKGFAAAVLGGLANPFGAIVGGLVLAMIESFGVIFISSGYKNTIALSVLILVMMVMPNGLLGKALRSGG